MSCLTLNETVRQTTLFTDIRQRDRKSKLIPGRRSSISFLFTSGPTRRTGGVHTREARPSTAFLLITTDGRDHGRQPQTMPKMHGVSGGSSSLPPQGPPALVAMVIETP